MKNKSFLKMLHTQLENWLTSPEFKLRKLIKTGPHEQVEAKYNKIKNKVDTKVIEESYVNLLMAIRMNAERFNEKEVKLLLNDIDEKNITKALFEALKVPVPALWDIFFQNQNIKSKIDFTDSKIINLAVQFNSVEALPYLVKEQAPILKDERQARTILKNCISDKREEIVNILLAADINCDSFKSKNEVVIPGLLELPPIHKELPESNNPVIRSIKSYIFSTKLEEKLSIKNEPKQKRQKI